MEDKRQQFRQSVEPSNVSSTSDVDMFNDQRQRFFAHPPAVQRTHAGNLERVEEEPNNMADSSTDPKCRAKHMFYGHSTEQRYLAHDGPFKKPAQQGYYNRYPITPPYYDNRYPCGNPMCREAHYCYEHQTNRDYCNPAMPVPPSSSHYFTHDCHPGYVRPIHRTSPSFMNPNHPNTKRSEHELPRPKPEWPQGYRPGNHGQAPATPAQYLAALSGKDSVSNPPSTATSLRSINLEPYMYSSNFSSPRQSARLNRKRAISSSPLSVDSIDINSLIRTSPDSLIAYINAPRISSAGSYGHLSANGISPSPKPQRSPSMRSPMRFGCWQSTPSGSRPKSQIGNVTDSKETKNAPTIKRECPEKEIKSEPKEEESMIVDSNNNVEENKLTSVNSPTESDKRESDIEIEENNDAEKDENNNELVCLWKDCNMIFQSQDELVKHVNTDHIKKERRDFTCYWVDCQREQKPFKAQYMLVVHMRRHTGEKPNKCTYEGCNKAYSRLENLKTHERSHTGERPYVCEYENCTKAFTNASDRAKHQNRTHSSVKPYVCTVADCTKRYTDPSSLRKHKKTCHPEHFTGAKKPKIDETKGKPDTTKGSPSSTKTLGTDSRGKVPQGSSVTQRTHAASGNPSSPSESIVRDQTKNTQANTLGTIQQDFSPQSYTGDLTSSSSCVDSPQSINFACDGADQPEETSQTKANSNTPKNSSLPISPQAAHVQPFPERPEMGRQGGDVLVENPVIPNQISLPTINKQNEVGKWIADVSQRMNNASKYSSEIKDNLPADFSSRRSSESGVSSYISSRRSSEVSTHHNRQPHAAPPGPGEMLADEYPPNRQASDAYYMQQFPPVSQWNNNPRRNDFYDEMIRPSPIPDTFDLGQRRSSSGYGSHHNLAVIRSPVFHKVPIQNTPDPPRVSNRRMSDSIICEADSSNRYLPLHSNGNVVPRRSSEPATHYYSSGSNELHMPNYSSRQHKTQISMDKQRNQLPLPDIYQGQHRDSNTLNRQVLQSGPQPLERGQKLTHYPYSMEAPNQDHLYPHPPNYPQRNKSHQHVRDPPQKGLWEYEQQINQQLDQIRNQQGNHYMTSQKSYANSSGTQMVNGDVPGQDGPFEVMVNGMGNLNTSEIVEEAVQANGPSNMVVNDMNTLLNSLIEEDRYLEKKQGQENMTSALSHIF